MSGAPCHDRTGTGNGMVVLRGFDSPPSYHIDRLRSMPVEYFQAVATDGKGNMPAYGALISRPDRWAIANYVRALQLSQHVPAADLTDQDREQLRKEDSE
ncbi:MAG: cytochrome c [Pirellulaceae bacterium]